jgi:hypothetical protein
MASSRIAFDMDGVLANMESELVRQAMTLFGDAMTRQRHEPADAPADPHSEPAARTEASSEASGDETPPVDETPPSIKWKLTSRQQQQLWRHIASIRDFWETLEEIEPGTIKRLAAVAADRHWEVIFLTRRPETAGATAQVQSQRWLASKGFALPSVYVVQASRGRIAAALGLDAVIDDRSENCLDVLLDSDARAILVRRDDREPLPGAATRRGIRVVKSMKECLDMLIQPAWLSGLSGPAEARRPDGSDRTPIGLVSRTMRALGFKEPMIER